MKSLAWSDVIPRKRHATSDWLNSRTHSGICKMCGKVVLLTGAQKYCDECSPKYYKQRSHESQIEARNKKLAVYESKRQQAGIPCCVCGRIHISKSGDGYQQACCSFTCKETLRHRNAAKVLA